MIARLEGRVERVAPGEVVVDTGGVGYRVRVPLSTYAALPPGDGTCRLRIITVVREDEIQLYGFSTADEEELFRWLQAVSGVGPKLALRILSGISPAELRRALSSEDAASLTVVPGVGRKLAQRIVLELKDRVGSTAPAGVRVSPPPADAARDAVAALEALGYPHRVAAEAVRKAEAGGARGLEEIVREALRGLKPRR